MNALVKNMLLPGKYPDLVSLAILILRLTVGTFMLTHGIGKLLMFFSEDPIIFADPIGLGFIKDSSGKICKTGDLVSVETSSYVWNWIMPPPMARLLWNENEKCFCLKSFTTGETAPLERDEFFLME
jgi:hypothetical protein